MRAFLISCFLGAAVWLQALVSHAQVVTKFACGQDLSLFLKDDGSLWAAGCYQFGTAARTADNSAAGRAGKWQGYTTLVNSMARASFTNRPQQIAGSNVTALACSSEGYFYLFLKNDGSLWGAGVNIDGQLGDGTCNSTDSPKMIVAHGVTAVSAGLFHGLFLKSDGSLWAMGNNQFGQLGNGDSVSGYTNLPQLIVSGNVTAIAAGASHSLFLKSDGSLWGMGDDAHGELGESLFGSHTNRPTPIVLGDVTAIAAGDSDSLFIKSDGSLWGMGLSRFGALGLGTNLVVRPQRIIAGNVTAVSAGSGSTLFLKSDGSLWGMGRNDDGQLGASPFPDANRPDRVVAGNNVTGIAAGRYHSLFLKGNGTLWAVGLNSRGEFGNGTFGSPDTGTNRPQPIIFKQTR